MIAAKKILEIHEDVLSPLRDFARERGYCKVLSVLERGEEHKLCLLDINEAHEINTLIGAYRDDITLRFPYYDDEEPFFNPMHGEKFDFANIDVVMTVVFKIQAAYPSHFSPEASE